MSFATASDSAGALTYGTSIYRRRLQSVPKRSNLERLSEPRSRYVSLPDPQASAQNSGEFGFT
jgi:hypothetical protein